MADLSQNILYLVATQLSPLHVSLNATFAGAVTLTVSTDCGAFIAGTRWTTTVHQVKYS